MSDTKFVNLFNKVRTDICNVAKRVFDVTGLVSMLTTAVDDLNDYRVENEETVNDIRFVLSELTDEFNDVKTYTDLLKKTITFVYPDGTTIGEGGVNGTLTATLIEIDVAAIPFFPSPAIILQNIPGTESAKTVACFDDMLTFNPLLVELVGGLAGLGEITFADAFYYPDQTGRAMILPASMFALFNSIFQGNQGGVEIREITVKKDRDFVSNIFTWRAYAQQRLIMDPAMVAKVKAQTSYDYEKLILVEQSGDPNKYEPFADMEETFFFPDDDTKNRHVAEWYIFDQGNVGSCYANALSTLIFMNRVIQRMFTVITTTLDGKFVHGFEISSEDPTNNIFLNAAEQFDTKDEAVILAHETLNLAEEKEIPSRAWVQYMSKRRRAELADNTRSVLDQGNTLDITIEALRTFGTVTETIFRYPTAYGISIDEIDTVSVEEQEEFVQKFAFPPDAYLVTRAKLRGDTNTMQLQPVFVKGIDIFGLNAGRFGNPASEYIPDPIDHSIFGITDPEQNKVLTLIKAYLVNHMYLFLNIRVFDDNITKWSFGVIPTPTAEDIAAADADPSANKFHTVILTGFYDTLPNSAGYAGYFMAQNSWGTEEMEIGDPLSDDFQIVPFDNARTDSGVVYFSYKDFFIHASSVWGLVSDSWDYMTPLMEPFNFYDPTIFNTEETEARRTARRANQVARKVRRTARSRSIKRPKGRTVRRARSRK